MFDNIGGKIKVLAKVEVWVGIAASVIMAIIMWGSNSYRNPTVFSGFMVLILGSLSSWVGAFFTYGFGELIEDVGVCRRYVTDRADAEKAKKRAEGSSYVPSNSHASLSNSASTANGWRCEKCGMKNSDGARFCKGCGEYK